MLHVTAKTANSKDSMRTDLCCLQSSTGTLEDPGLIPRCVDHLFEQLREDAANKTNCVSMIHVTYVEIYNDRFYNLLAGAATDDHAESLVLVSQRDRDKKIEIREHPIRGVYLSGGSGKLRVPVTSAAAVLSLIAKGTKMRQTSATQLNERSSRSHAVLTLEIESNDYSSSANSTTRDTSNGSDAVNGATRRASLADCVSVRMGKLQLVDLAGSERVTLSKAEGARLQEAQSINLSLTLLGDVLMSLSKVNKCTCYVANFIQSSVVVTIITRFIRC
jgi:Kinesin motor domain